MRLLYTKQISFFFALFTFLLVAPRSGMAQAASINAGSVYQTIDGFGGENGGPWNWASGPLDWNNLTSSQADALFSPTAGIGVSVYRSDNQDGPASTLPPDMASMEAAYARGAQIELTMAGPPSSMKYSGSFADGTPGASGSCVSVPWSTYANYIVQYIQNVQSNGNLTVSWIDVQNEPNSSVLQSDGFGSCQYTGAALDSLVTALGPALKSAGLSTKIILGSAFSYANSASYFGACISDSGCAPYVSVVSGHGYGYPDSPLLYNAPGKRFWMGETSPNADTSFDANMDSALGMAQNMHSFLVNGQVSSYNWWELGYISNGGYCVDCQLIDQNWTLTKRYYAFGNFSKFIRPGMVMIGATNNPQSGVYVSAYLNQANGAFAIVAVNTNGGSISQTFNLGGLSAGSVTPYITDPSNNLASQSSIAVSGNSFTATLTSSSVTTFVAASKGPAAPSNLTGTVVQ
jgi:glucuronoarabinoxylan endo-1,4-beta-xylanase